MSLPNEHTLSQYSIEELAQFNKVLVKVIKSKHDARDLGAAGKFQQGDIVMFSNRGLDYSGTIIKVKRKRALVRVRGYGREWDVPLGLLTKIKKDDVASKPEVNMPIKITVHDTCDDTSDYTNLRSEWCSCNNPEFLCYPEDGACECGTYKHHVHCKCGGVMQVG